jgi:pimeloyl-ACP methyl ester carboxylesterase
MMPFDARWQHREVDGRRIAYVDTGGVGPAGDVGPASGVVSGGRGPDGPGRAVVLVHGNFASKRWFRELLEAPPAGARLLALDLPNFGDSDPLGAPITMAAYASAVRGFVERCGLERPVLVGHSMGGAVVLEAAAADPDAWSALVLVDGSAPDGLITPEAHYPLLDAIMGNGPLLRHALTPLLASHRPDDFDDLVADGLRMHPDAFRGNARALHDLDLAPRLAAFRGRVLVLRGALDPLITAEMAERTAAAFTGSAHVQLETWPDVGHSPATEAPARFAARLAELLEALRHEETAP